MNVTGRLKALVALDQKHLTLVGLSISKAAGLELMGRKIPCF
jgi:hypothetical protein